MTPRKCPALALGSLGAALVLAPPQSVGEDVLVTTISSRHFRLEGGDLSVKNLTVLEGWDTDESSVISIFLEAGSLELEACTFRDNFQGGNNRLLFLQGGTTAVLRNCTLLGTDGRRPQGCWVQAGGSLTLIDCLVEGLSHPRPRSGTRAPSSQSAVSSGTTSPTETVRPCTMKAMAA